MNAKTRHIVHMILYVLGLITAIGLLILRILSEPKLGNGTGDLRGIYWFGIALAIGYCGVWCYWIHKECKAYCKQKKHEK